MSSEYSAIRGGLKLKGASSKPSGITKKKKKSKKPADEAAVQKALQDEDSTSASKTTKGDAEMTEEQARELDPRDGDGKTASEREMEETRRRRLNEKLLKEGVKTHKERVEGLNKYLSTLSEHHDMPRIGPG